MSRVQVEIGSRVFSYPIECPCCGADTDGEIEIPLKPSEQARDSARKLLFPYCRRCLAHVTRWDTAATVSAAVLLVGVLAGAFVGIWSEGWHGLAVFGASVLCGVFAASVLRSRANARRSPSCASAHRAVTYLGWSGTTNAFAFESAAYTARFAEENIGSLANVEPRLESLLAAHKVARLDAPTPANALRVVPPPRSIDDWFTHLDAQPTRIGRRLALTRALAIVYDEEERKQLVQVVQAKELEILVGNIDGLPIATQRRHLERAIADARADNLPEVLRESLLRELVKRALKIA